MVFKSQLVSLNQELLFQNEEKAKRAAELVIANKELLFHSSVPTFSHQDFVS